MKFQESVRAHLLREISLLPPFAYSKYLMLMRQHYEAKLEMENVLAQRWQFEELK
jgi:hypothetical protein